MEREVPFFCRDAVVSYRIADVAELERETSPTVLLRFASLRFPLLRFASFRFVSLRVASLCFVLLRFAPLCFALLHFASWDRSGIVLGFRFVLLCVASLWSASFRSASFRSARFWLAFALFCFVSLCFASFCLGTFWERSGSVLGASGALF